VRVGGRLIRATKVLNDVVNITEHLPGGEGFAERPTELKPPEMLDAGGEQIEREDARTSSVNLDVEKTLPRPQNIHQNLPGRSEKRHQNGPKLIKNGKGWYAISPQSGKTEGPGMIERGKLGINGPTKSYPIRKLLLESHKKNNMTPKSKRKEKSRKRKTQRQG